VIENAKTQIPTGKVKRFKTTITTVARKHYDRGNVNEKIMTEAMSMVSFSS